MKLLFCRECGDVRKLHMDRQMHACSCGASAGRYVDHLNAEVSGPCLALGINNSSLRLALTNHQRSPRIDGLGHRIEAFIIPETAPTLRRLT